MTTPNLHAERGPMAIVLDTLQGNLRHKRDCDLTDYVVFYYPYIR